MNKVNTKADIRFKLSEANWIPLEVKQKLRAKYANKINSDDELVITSQKYGTQKVYSKYELFTTRRKIVFKEYYATSSMILSYNSF